MSNHINLLVWHLTPECSPDHAGLIVSLFVYSLNRKDRVAFVTVKEACKSEVKNSILHAPSPRRVIYCL